jgi:CheY-like chemotaxis protein
VWIIGAALMSSLAILRVKAIEESQITYSNLQAHELRTPLHQILAITQLLRSSISEFAEAPVTTRDTSLNTLQQVRDLLPLLDAIDTSGTTLHGIVENILTFLDLSTKDNRWSGVPGNPNVINRMGGPQTLTAMIEELIHAMSDDDKRGRFGSGQPTAQIETIFEIIPHGLGENVTEDYGGALRRALARVIHNAYRYIDTRGCVQITVDNVKSMLPPEGCERLASTRRIVITVTDNGHGMSQDFVREKLGEPWAKEDLYATGSGLSVHLAYRIIDLMNGEMEITSASGSGCAVTIEVPLPVSRIPHSPVAMFTGRKVALVGFDRGDNDPTHLDRLGKSLANQYHKHGCEIVSSEEADLVVVDGSMEEHPTGLAEVARLSAPEVVILAASAEDEHQIVAAMSGPTRHVRRLIKPVTPTLICQTLQEVSSAPMTPMDDPDAPTRRRPRFDTSAGRNADRPSPPGSWRPGSVGVEDAVASLSLGDYFSSRNRGGSRISSVGSAGSEISPDTVSTVGTGVVPPLDSVESADSRWPAPDLATSTITTPSEDSPEVAADTPPSSGPTPDPRVPTKVLVVEDNIINRKILVKILKASPLPFLQIIEAEDGVDAVERFREFGAPAIVLLDINMPRMDGYAAAIEMRMIEKRRVAAAAEAAATAAVKTAPSTIGTLAISPSPSSPGYMTPMCRSKIIAVTALSGEDERHRGLVECGMDQWLTKPCHKPTLQKVVDQARQELAACGF